MDSRSIKNKGTKSREEERNVVQDLVEFRSRYPEILFRRNREATLNGKSEPEGLSDRS